MSDSAVSSLLARARDAIEAGDEATAMTAWEEAEAISNLVGVSVKDRITLPIPSADALSWSLWGAASGNTSAMFTAACAYRDGVGTRRNRMQSVRWYLTMLGHRDGHGIHEAHQVVKRGMTDAEILQAGVLAGQQHAAQALISTLPANSRRGRHWRPAWWRNAQSQ